MTFLDPPAGRYRIADVARLSGFTASALRYYEQAGVLAAPERTAAGYRLYTDRDVERLRLIARAKDLGCSLGEITDLVQAWDGDECGPVKHRLRALVHQKVGEVETHLAEQAAFADQLRATADALAARPVDGPCDDSCGCTTTSTTPLASSQCGPAGGCSTAAGGRLVPLGQRDSNDTRKDAPIACSLTGKDVAARITAWHHLLGDVTSRTPLPGGIRIELGDRAHVGQVAALVDAEQTCCPFFSFAITLDQRGLALEVTALADGQDLLATLFGVPT